MSAFHRRACFGALAFALLAVPAGAQNVVLDRQVRAGDLVLFPSVRDDTVFYYAPSQPRLAEKDGKPQFSFLRYVENTRGSEGEDAAREGAGGGIVHALVTLAVTDAQLERARQELERQIKGARIEGPVAYSAGTFGLVSTFADEEGEFTRSVVGVGKAPLLDGSKAAVSIHLTRLGAKVLWESFQTPTPDISFQFEMELEGYRSPKQALIEADFDRIYQHESFDLGASLNAGPMMLGVEISKAMDDLYESKAIKVTQIGEDEKLDQLVQMAYSKLIEMMFQPPNQGLGDLASTAQGRQGMLDRASDALNRRRRETEAANQGRRQRDDARRRQHGTAVATDEAADRLEAEAVELEQEAQRLDREAREAEERVSAIQAQLATRDADASPTPAPKPEPAPEPAPKPEPAPEAKPAPKPAPEPAPAPKPAPEPAPEAKPAPEPAPEAKPAPEPAPEAKPAPEPGEPDRQAQLAAARDDARRKRAAADAARQRADARRQEATAARNQAVGVAGDLPEPELEGTASVPSLSALFSYRMKETRQRGVFRIDLNKYTQDTQSFPFAENIGDLRRYFDDQDFFRQVNLDDPFFRQREIAVFVDGLNASDFGDYINFVSVLVRKTHDGGAQTLEEVRIHRNNFNSQGNDFRVVYGWKDDESRERWLDYEYKTTWSFFGGNQVEGTWTPSNASAINLAPPYQPRKVTLDADPELLKDANVRAVTVKLYYDLAGAELTKETTLNAMRGEFSQSMGFMLPAGSEAYDYEITWRLRGNKQVSSGRQESVGSILFVDELPET